MSNDTFKPTHEPISEIFGNKKSFYRVPYYQRPYSWESEQVEQLWDDLYEAYKDETENYFLGSIIITPSKQEEGYFDVIDGQQRITTLIILFRAATVSGMLSSEIANEVKDAVQSIIRKTPRLKLKTGITRQIDFEHDIINNENFKDIKADKKNKYKNTAIIFNEKIKEMKKNGDKLEDFMRYILDNTTLIKIECTNRSFAIKLFQVLNDRGLDLTQADLVKSFLLGKLEEGEHEKFIAKWEEIKNSIESEDGATMEDLLTYYEYYLLASNPKKSLSEEIETWIKNKNKNSNDFIHELLEFSKTFVNVANDVNTYSFNYLRHQVYRWPILTAAKMEMSDDDYEVLRDKLAGFYYLYWIAGYTAPKIKQISFNIIGWIKENKNINEIIDKIDEKINKDDVTKLCSHNLKDSDVYGERWLKPLLVAIEYQQTDGSRFTYIELDKKLHVEHILPKDKKHHDTYDFDNKHEDYVNKLANLTLLSGKKNIQASNNSFDEKMEIYQGKGKDGITAFIITQEIINYNEWNKENFEVREKWLLAEIDKFLKLNRPEK